MPTKVVGVVGRNGAGKDVVADYLHDRWGVTGRMTAAAGGSAAWKRRRVAAGRPPAACASVNDSTSGGPGPPSTNAWSGTATGSIFTITRNTFENPEGLAAALERLGPHAPLSEAIERFWREPRHREARSWTDHRDINRVMLATSLCPDGFLRL